MFETPSGSIYAVDEVFRNQIDHRSSEADSRQPRQSLPKILVVDDERRIADTLAEILEMSGFQVATAYDGGSSGNCGPVSSRLSAL
jgi:PleD family two-component response regulator